MGQHYRQLNGKEVRKFFEKKLVNFYLEHSMEQDPFAKRVTTVRVNAQKKIDRNPKKGK
jgi:hypothetical protein